MLITLLFESKKVEQLKIAYGCDAIYEVPMISRKGKYIFGVLSDEMTIV